MLRGGPVTTGSSVGRWAGARQPIARWLAGSLLAGVLMLLGTGAAVAQQFVFSRYTQMSGLRNLGIEMLLVDRAGDLWVATDGGMYRYDGTTFTPYDKSRGIPADAVLDLAASPSGTIFARVDAGLYSGNADHFAPLLTSDGPILADQYAPLIAPADDRVLFVGNRQLMQAHRGGGPGSLWQVRAAFAPAVLANHPELASVEGMLQADDGTLWLGCGLRLCRYDGRELTVFGAAEGVPEAQYGALLQDRRGAVWARSLNHLVVLARGARRFADNSPPHVLLANRLRRMALTLDPLGRVVTRNSIGIARWDGAAWREFGSHNGLPDYPITDAIADADGNFWLASSGVGLYQWRGYANLESWTKDQGLDAESVWNINRDSRHRLILGTDLGCRMLDESAHEVVACPYSGLPAQETNTSAVDPAGGYWASYQTSQLWRVPPGGTRAQRVTTVPDQFDGATMFFDRSGTGWIAAWDFGLAKIDGTTLAVTRLQPPGKPRVDDVVQRADGSIWIGATNGLYRVAGDRFVKIDTTVDGQQIGMQTLAAAADGSIWGTRIGEKILHLTPPPHQVVEWQEPEALKGSTIYSMRGDARGWVWANTGEGLGVYDGHVWRRIESEDGLIWADTAQFALYPDMDGSIWVGTSRGVTHIKDPVAWVNRISRPLKLALARAQLGTQSLLTAPKPVVQWRDNAALDVAFGSHSFDRSPSTELRYRLLGLSTEWYSSRTFGIHIPALAPGHYRLEAMAVDGPHARHSATVNLSFDVQPPWWETLAFRVLAALLLATLLAACWRWQNQRLQRRQRILEQAHREREALLERATRDALTGLWNRATILEFLTGEIEQVRNNGGTLAVAVIDVDYFKSINDTYGHAGGDEVLQELARRLRAALRQRDSLGRYGGEELLVVMPGLAREDRGSLMEALRENICGTAFPVGQTQLRVTVSVGVAWLESAGELPDELIRRADAALYEAKAAGRNRVRCSSGGYDGSALEASASRRYLQEFIDRVKREAGKRGVETELK